MSKQVTEVVIYKIKKEHVLDFDSVAMQIKEEVKMLKGFISIETKAHTDDEGVFKDVCIWETKQDALNAFEKFQNFKCAEKFMSIIDGAPLYVGHFY